MALEMRDLGYSLDKISVLRGGSLRWEELEYPEVGTGADES